MNFVSRVGEKLFSIIGSENGLVIWSDKENDDVSLQKIQTPMLSFPSWLFMGWKIACQVLFFRDKNQWEGARMRFHGENQNCHRAIDESIWMTHGTIMHAYFRHFPRFSEWYAKHFFPKQDTFAPKCNRPFPQAILGPSRAVQHFGQKYSSIAKS